MCEWGLALAYGQNLNDALVMSLEPWFLANEPLAFQAVRRAQALLLSAESEAERSSGGEEGGEEEEEDAGAATSAHGSGDEEEAPDSRRRGGESSTRPSSSSSSSTAMRRRDLALVSALSLKFVATLEVQQGKGEATAFEKSRVSKYRTHWDGWHSPRNDTPPC